MEINLRQEKPVARQNPSASTSLSAAAGNEPFARAPADMDSADAARVLPVVYEELRRLAGWCLRGERGGHTLQRTALVHEAFVRLSQAGERPWKDREHFIAIAARTMRQVLVDYALRRRAEKRGGGRLRQSLDEVVELYEAPSVDLIALHEALEKLRAIDRQQAQIVDLRFFGGLTFPETARALGLPLRTVEREWCFARAWLKSQIDGRADRDA